jgi:HEAT repeat protein
LPTLYTNGPHPDRQFDTEVRRFRAVSSAPEIVWHAVHRPDHNARVETDSVAELVERASAAARLADETDDWDGESGAAYAALLRRAAHDGAAALRLGLELIGSAEPGQRCTGSLLLGHASDLHAELRTESATALIALAQRETEACVLSCLPRALERTYDERGVPVLVTLAGHADAGIRQQVAMSFAGLLSGLPDGPDIRTLLALSRDEDPEVRNWATFTLGSQSEVDTAEVRAALWERTTDPHPEAREEGINGLACRHQLQVLPLLVELLEDPEGAHVLVFGAAAILGVPELLPALEEYLPEGRGVVEAVAACDPRQRDRELRSAWDLVCALERLRPELGAAVYMNRFETGLWLALGEGVDAPGRYLEGLLGRVDGDPLRAAELLCTELPSPELPSSEPPSPDLR